MSSTAYYLAWLAGGLAASAMASAWIARHLRWRVLRRLKAQEAVDALARYCQWVAAQRHAVYSQGDGLMTEAALHDLLALVRGVFPEHAHDAVSLLVAHARLTGYLGSQQALRLRDPEVWLESDHEEGFAKLAGELVAVADALAAKFGLADGTSARPMAWQGPRTLA